MRELIEYMVKHIVDHPEAVQVNQVEGERTIIFEVRVAPDDLGKVIGKQGRIANAMRTILRAAAMREKKNVNLEILP
ncbi:MAG TPA: KH domain-containing protein [Armatimonadetes bacterium]|nr:KH domain-containing protein [Armatimonadota bacterium]